MTLICKTKVLNFNPQETGEVWVRLCVKEQRTGVVTTSDILALNVQSSYGKGWMILGQDNDRTTLSFVRPGDQETGEGKKRIYTPIVGFIRNDFSGTTIGLFACRVKADVDSGTTELLWYCKRILLSI